MLKVERAGKRLVSFDNLRLQPLGDFYDLTDFVVNSPREFFGEIGEKIFVLGTYVVPAPGVTPIDVLGLDAEGAAVALVISSSAEEAPLARAITAAGSIATWTPQQFWRRLNPTRVEQLKQFLGAAIGHVNERQRVFVVGESHRDELLTVSRWLSQRGVDIVTIRTEFGVDPSSGDEFLRCGRVEAQPTSAEGPRSEPRSRPQPPTPGGKPPSVAAAGASSTSPSAEPPPHGAAGLPDDQPVGGELPDVSELFDLPEESGERRRFPRRSDVAASVLHVEYAGRRIGAGMADLGPGGIGIEMQNPLPTGAPVIVHGELEGEERHSIHAAGRVRHCRFGEEAFRLGIAFDQPQEQFGA